MASVLDSHLGEIPDLCRRYGVARLELFGSAAGDAFDPRRSDLDFLVEFDADSSRLFDRYFGLKESLEALYGRPVDLVTLGSLRNPYFIEAVNKSRRVVYAAEDPKLLEDVRDAAAFIREVVRGKTLPDYQGERLLRQAIERNFEIIGEAMNRLALHDPETAGLITKHRRIVDFRNVLAHGYDLIDHRIVWSTIDEEVPVLLAEVEALLGRTR